jgi:hypothetical protein
MVVYGLSGSVLLLALPFRLRRKINVARETRRHVTSGGLRLTGAGRVQGVVVAPLWMRRFGDVAVRLCCHCESSLQILGQPCNAEVTGLVV